MILSLIAAASENGVIGRDGDLPWRLPDDMRFFRETTMGHPIIMGRRTYESNRGPLRGRLNIVVSRTLEDPRVRVAESLGGAIEIAREALGGGDGEVFVIGGARLYGEALPIAQRIYLTRIHAEIEGDTRFPDVDWSQWRLVSEDRHGADDRHEHAFTIRVFERMEGGQ